MFGDDHADQVAATVLAVFDRLPQRAKPLHHSDESKDWIPLSGIVISEFHENLGFRNHWCASLGTGMKCLPAKSLPKARGCNLHDWHAEIIAIRAFNLYLLEECLRLAKSNGATSVILERSSAMGCDERYVPPFTVKGNVRLHMYSSEIPCGDASMENVMKNPEHSTSWQIGALDVQDHVQLNGRGFFSQLGVVRRKPGRADAPTSLSKSCSDKIALKQCISLLSSLTSLFVCPHNTYLQDLVLPEGQMVKSALQRCFGPEGRMTSLVQDNDRFQGSLFGYQYRPFNILGTSTRFTYAREESVTRNKQSGSNMSAMWTPYKTEVLILGVTQGSKQFSSNGASNISRVRMWKRSIELAHVINDSVVIQSLAGHDYSEVKHCRLLLERREIKEKIQNEVLKPWIRNRGDDEFSLVDSK